MDRGMQDRYRQLHGDVAIYGPYVGQDGRKNVVVYDCKTKKMGSVSYAKVIWETTTGAVVPEGMEVDHIDNDFTNDAFKNLQLLSRRENVAKAHKFYAKPRPQFICPICSTTFERRRGNVQVEKPVCSRACQAVLLRKMFKGIRFRRGARVGERERSRTPSG